MLSNVNNFSAQKTPAMPAKQQAPKVAFKGVLEIPDFSHIADIAKRNEAIMKAAIAARKAREAAENVKPELLDEVPFKVEAGVKKVGGFFKKIFG